MMTGCVVSGMEMANRAAMKDQQRPWRGPRIEKHRSKGLRLVITKLMKEERSFAWLAKHLGVSRQALSEWEDIPDDHIPTVARVMGIDEGKLRA